MNAILLSMMFGGGGFFSQGFLAPFLGFGGLDQGKCYKTYLESPYTHMVIKKNLFTLTTLSFNNDKEFDELTKDGIRGIEVDCDNVLTYSFSDDKVLEDIKKSHSYLSFKNFIAREKLYGEIKKESVKFSLDKTLKLKKGECFSFKGSMDTKLVLDTDYAGKVITLAYSRDKGNNNYRHFYRVEREVPRGEKVSCLNNLQTFTGEGIIEDEMKKFNVFDDFKDLYLKDKIKNNIENDNSVVVYENGFAVETNDNWKKGIPVMVYENGKLIDYKEEE